jgi:DNA-binding beta-propeller fold protein YncE
VTVISTPDNNVVTTINNVCNKPIGLAVTPDGNFVYIGCAGDSNVAVIRTSDNTLFDSIPTSASATQGVAVSPDGQFVYFTGGTDLIIVRTSDNTE